MMPIENFQTRNDVLSDTRGWAARYYAKRGIDFGPIIRFEQIGPEFVIEHVALALCVRTEDILTTRRDPAFFHARRVAMYLAADLTRQSLPRLALVFGKRDHTTIMHGRNKIRALIKTSPADARQIAKLRQFIIDSWEAAKELPIAAR